MQPSGEVRRFDVVDLLSPPADRKRSPTQIYLFRLSQCRKQMILSTPIALRSVVASVLLSATPFATAQSDARKSNETQRGLGLILADEEGQIVVHAIRPDSIAATSNAIEVGARLTGLEIGDKKTSLVGKSSRDVRNLVRGASYDEPEITIWFVPLNGEPQSEVTLRRSIADIESDRDLWRLEIDVPTSIEQAVLEFNEKAQHHRVGKTQPPLTAEEVVATIRGLHQEKNASWTDDVFKRFQDIAETKEIPAGSQLSIISSWHVGGYNITVWWVDLRIPTGSDSTNGFRIRDRRIASRALTTDEKKASERLNSLLIEQHPNLFEE